MDLQTYLIGHKVHDSMGDNAKKLKQKDGSIHSEGFFTFQKPMEISQFEATVFVETVDAAGNQAPILQILFMEANPHNNFTSPVAGRAGEGIQFSKCAQQPVPVLPLVPVIPPGPQTPPKRKRSRSNSNTPSKKANKSAVAVIDSPGNAPMDLQPSSL